MKNLFAQIQLETHINSVQSMKRPNQELFRILKFAIRFPGWHTYGSDVRKHVYRAEALGFLEVSKGTKQFRLSKPSLEYTPPIELPNV